MTPHTPPPTGVLIQRIAALAMTAMLAVSAGSGCAIYEKFRKGYEELNNPTGAKPLMSDEEKIELIDSMRAKGSFEAARERLTNTAQSIAEQIVAAVPGQTWRFADDENARIQYRDGAPCTGGSKLISEDIAGRPRAKTAVFGTTFSVEDFKTAAGIVRQVAAEYGATTESSLFNESAKRDYDVQGIR
jgi:hypothetical protein